MSTQIVTFNSFTAQSSTVVVTTNTVAYNNFNSFVAYIEGTGTKTLRYAFTGYNSGGSKVVDLYWYNNGTSINIPMRTDIVSWRLQFSFSDSSTITPNDIVQCSAHCTKIWDMGADGLPINDRAPNVIENAVESPYPKGLWRIESGEITTGLLPQADELGAFANAVNLMQVSIPRSCKKIGRYTFRNTQLSSVTIASDCDYYSTSFPAGCVVNFYPD